MSVHMLKLCVGIDSLQHLEQCRDLYYKKDGTPYHQHITRYQPKRADEILDGGSLYWVIKRYIQVRQRIIGFEKIETPDGIKCKIMMDPKLILTQSQPRRPHQGWRYLNATDAPEDIANKLSVNHMEMPDKMASDLRELGLI